MIRLMTVWVMILIVSLVTGCSSSTPDVYQMLLYKDNSSSLLPSYFQKMSDLGEGYNLTLKKDGSGEMELPSEVITIKNTSDDAFLLADKQMIDKENGSYIYINTKYKIENNDEPITFYDGLYRPVSIDEVKTSIEKELSRIKSEVQSNDYFMLDYLSYNNTEIDGYDEDSIGIYFNYWPTSLTLDDNGIPKYLWMENSEDKIHYLTSLGASTYSLEGFSGVWSIVMSADHLSATIKVSDADGVFHFKTIKGYDLERYQSLYDSLNGINANDYILLERWYAWGDEKFTVFEDTDYSLISDYEPQPMDIYFRVSPIVLLNRKTGTLGRTYTNEDGTTGFTLLSDTSRSNIEITEVYSQEKYFEAVTVNYQDSVVLYVKEVTPEEFLKQIKQ